MWDSIHAFVSTSYFRYEPESRMKPSDLSFLDFCRIAVVIVDVFEDSNQELWAGKPKRTCLRDGAARFSFSQTIVA
jgi:hypothetical protein